MHNFAAWKAIQPQISMPAHLTLRSSGSGGSVAAWPPVKEAAELVAALLGEVAQLPAFLAGPSIEAPQGALRPRQVQQALVVVHRTRAVEPARCLYRLCCRLRASAIYLMRQWYTAQGALNNRPRR